MKSKYFNYLITVVIMHLVALFSGPITFSSPPQTRGKRPTVAFNAHIKSFNSHPVISSRRVSEGKSLNIPAINPRTQSNQSLETTDQVTDFGDQGADLRQEYFAALKAHIEQHKHYPMMSRKLGQTGKVVVAFTLLGDGSFTNLHLHESCPFERLNLAALDAVKSVGRFKPIPKELGEKFMDIQVPIEYQSIN
jgi:protein TonB